MQKYVALNAGARLSVSWPPGWCMQIQSLDDDSEYGLSNVEDWERNYSCCLLELCVVGCVFEDRGCGGGADDDDDDDGGAARGGGWVPEFDNGMRLMMSDGGLLICYSGWKDDALYTLGRNAREFAVTGLRAVEPLYEYTGFVPRWPKAEATMMCEGAAGRGLGSVARWVTRHHGSVLPLAHPIGATLRVCSLGCLRTRQAQGTLMRELRGSFPDAVPVGIVVEHRRLRGPRAPRRDGRRKSRNEVPVFCASPGCSVYACDASRGEYVRLADSLLAFAGLGLLNMRRAARFPNGRDRRPFDRRPDCPAGGFV